MSNNKKFDFRLAYIDLLLNLFTAIFFLFAISILLMNIKAVTEPPGTKKKAEAIILVDWPKEMDCDVDIWVQDPQGQVVSYQNRDAGIMHIERDDLGFRADALTVYNQIQSGQGMENMANQEVWVLRGKNPGIFTLNLHLYSCRIEMKQYGIGDPVKVPVTVSVITLNPNYNLIKEEKITMDRIWQEKTIFNFTFTSDGLVKNFTKNVKKLINVSPPITSGYGQ